MAKASASKGKPGKKKQEDQEESKDASHIAGDDELDELEDTQGGDDDIINKYGFKQSVELELTLPTEEKEIISDFEMKFLDRNYQAKQFTEGQHLLGGGLNHDHEDKVENLAQATSDYESNLADVIVYLKKCGYPLENCFVSFFSPVFSAFINCGLDPLPQSIKLTKEDLINVKASNGHPSDTYRLHLKFLWGIRSEYKGDDEGGLGAPQIPELEQQESIASSGRPQRKIPQQLQNISSQLDKENKRTKERTIGYIIEKVSQWRKLYNGYMDENHQLRRMSLEDAADKVGVSKKSLDDYLSQLRQGRALGFNFNLQKDQKVGDLRQFVKTHSQKIQKGAPTAAQLQSQPASLLGKRPAQSALPEPESLQRRTSQRGGELSQSTKKTQKK